MQAASQVPLPPGEPGTVFEQHVDAYWLAQLLVQAIPPILHDCAVVEVHLQTEHLGWHTDDLLSHRPDRFRESAEVGRPGEAIVHRQRDR